VIVGIGVDLVQIERVRDALTRHGEPFAARILTASELEAWRTNRDQPRFLAKHFAAKEAFGKALGTGVSPPATLHAISVQHDARGKPGFGYDERLAAHMAANALTAHLSLNDERDEVVAFAVIENP
jgi:holo-[acyl-carrier protein] synthase